MPMSTTPESIPRPPIVTVMGHIDHGKSTLLDYIRKTKVTETEAGGITQHLSAYEAEHTLEDGTTRTITFLDTPGHEAFQHLRSRGSHAADVAILVVSADDGVKPQTMEALKAIQESHIPYVVAITKIDKNNADIERAKSSLVEHGVYLEGMGGDISYVPISSKTGEGIGQLLDLVLLTVDLEPPMGTPDTPATGVVIESHCDPKRGISAVLLVQNGTMKKGDYVVAGNTCAPLRIMENFLGKAVEEVTFSSPVSVVGFSDIPPVGESFTAVPDKKTAQGEMALCEQAMKKCAIAEELAEGNGELFVLPVIIKTDVVGSLDAIKHELEKHNDERTRIHVVHEGVGAVTENDLKMARGNKHTIVIGFDVSVDTAARELSERTGITIVTYNIIYDLTEWLPTAIEERRPKIQKETVQGTGLLLKVFSSHGSKHTIGVRIEEGTIAKGTKVQVLRKDELLGIGTIESIKSGPADTPEAREGNDYGIGLMLELADDTELRYGDKLVHTVTEEI
jgi:translation initiation factor IF-2